MPCRPRPYESTWLKNGETRPGARAGCAAVAPGPEHLRPTFPRHFWLTVDGAAAAGLGEVERALEGLQLAGEEMEGQPQLLDWYWQLLRRWTLAGLWLGRGELDRAREEGERLRTDACATAERTWQGLAWDVNTRVALARGEVQQARDQVERGMAAIDGVEAPIAGWQLHATAAEAGAALGQVTRAESHRKSSREIVLQLAASLDGHEASQAAFLASPAVVRVLDPSSSLLD